MSSFKNFAITFAITFCISVLVFGLVAYLIVPSILDVVSPVSDNKKVDKSDLIIGYIDDDSSKSDLQGNSFTVLLIGTDYQPSVIPGMTSSSDAFVLLRFSKESKKIIYSAIPSNTQVKVDGTATTLSTIYSNKGITYLCEKVSGLTGMSINYYAIASIVSFAELVDAIGGFNYSVPVDMYYEDPTQNLIIDVKKGHQLLDGETAVKVLRYCSDSRSDRMERSIKFIKTIFNDYTKGSFKSEATKIYDTIAPHITTNFDVEDLTDHLDLIFSYSSFEETVIEYPGENVIQDDVSYFIPNTKEAFTLYGEYKY